MTSRRIEELIELINRDLFLKAKWEYDLTECICKANDVFECKDLEKRLVALDLRISERRAELTRLYKRLQELS